MKAFLLTLVLLLACGGEPGDDFDKGPSNSEVEIGQVEEAITSQYSDASLTGKNLALGVSSLNGVPGFQANVTSGAPANQTYYVPFSTSFFLRFNAGGGFTGADLTRVQAAATVGESVLTNLISGYTYTHTTGNAGIKVVQLADDGGSDSSSIDKFFSVTCTAGTVLTEPAGPVPGLYQKISTANDACSIGVKLAKVKRLVSGTTPQDRVLRHGFSWALAGIGGLGDTTANTPNKLTDVTNRATNINANKNTMPGGQACLASTWTGSASNTYGLCVSVGCSFCSSIPNGY